MIRLKDPNQNYLLHSTSSYNYWYSSLFLKQYWSSYIKASKNNTSRDWCYPYQQPWAHLISSAWRSNLEGHPHSREESPHPLRRALFQLFDPLSRQSFQLQPEIVCTLPTVEGFTMYLWKRDACKCFVAENLSYWNCSYQGYVMWISQACIVSSIVQQNYMHFNVACLTP